MPAEQTRVFSSRAMLWLLFVPLATGYPASTSLSDARRSFPEPAGRETVEPSCGSSRHQNLTFPDGVWAAPLTRGPCAHGEWVVHEGPRLRCALRPCPNGQLPLKGRCLSHADASAALCSGGPVQLDSTGLPCCGLFSGTLESNPALDSPEKVFGVAANCPQGDHGNCEKEVRDIPKNEPEIKPED